MQLQRINDAGELLGLGGGQLQILHDDHVAELDALAQGFAQGELLGFLGDRLAEVAGLGAEHDAAADPQRGADGASAGAAGAFLFPRLLVGTLDLAGRLGAGGAAALRRPVGGDRIVHGLGAASVLNHLELHFQFALIFSF